MSAGAKKRRQHASFTSGAGHQCLGKHRYRNQEAADRAISELSGYARSYKCHICHRLHITSKPYRGKGAA